ncbi:MAG: glycosyl hydrolase [Acidobacteriia bacterium]|nr:glycosyl hydrolase [Terriglobia bacterium]
MLNRLSTLIAICVVIALCLSALPLLAQTVPIDSDTFSGFQARSIGPAVMGGRIADIAAIHEGQRLTVYIGAASGGVWKSLDGGTTFKSVFDKQPTQSIGSIAIDPSNPQIVWVGTGESWVRNSVSVGTGLYRTRDGGDNWDLMGLADSEHISRVLIHPKDGNVVYACALGHLWNSNEERGVFKTTDGGKTWKKILYVDDKTGCAEMAMDPQQPDTLYAAMWQVRREPWTFTSGGPGSGLFKSTDGGATWHPIRKGFPDGDLGRIGVAVAASKPSRLYAVVEARNHTALFRSDDSGDSWTEVNNSFNVSGRPFYFARLAVDPNNPDRVYKPGFGLTVSDDAGKSFSAVFSTSDDSGGVHGDHHAVWINPKNSEEIFDGDDGGVYKSLDRGNHWRYLQSLPVAQFYHVSYDMERPYNVYGGLQDNGTWMGPSRAVGGIANRDWHNIGFGDGFWAFSDPTDPDTAYVEYQGGHISRLRKSTHEQKEIKPLPRANEPEFRFNWNSPIHVSPNHPGTIYIGAQFLFRSRDKGESWDRISPDLTTNDPDKQHQEKSGGLTIDNSDAERYETIYTISESPKNGDVIWAGTDDGNVQITRDGGKSWANVVKNIPSLPPHTWVSTIEAGHFDAGTAYATFDGHATGDMKTYVYKTTDYGQTWTALSTPDLKGYAHVVREDLINPNLLFVGTEFGLFLTVDGGKDWAQFTGKLPNVAVRDMAIQPRESDLLIATHGRGIYVLDDLTSLRAITPEILAQDVALLPARPAELALPAFEQRFDGDAEFVGRSLPETAPIVYYQKKRNIFGTLKIEIYDAQGNLVNTLQGDPRRGVSRVGWAERLKPPKVPPAASLVEQPFAFFGPQVEPGTYTIKLIKGKQTYAGKIDLVPDPRSNATTADLDLQHKAVMQLYDMLAQLTYVVDATVDLRDQVRQRAAQATSDRKLKAQLDKLAAQLEDFRSTLVSVKEGGMITGEHKLRENLGELYGGVNGYEGRPTQSQIERTAVLKKQLDDATAKFQDMSAKDVPAANTALAKSKLEALKVLSKDDWSKKQQ